MPTVLITGAGKGLGRELAQTFARQGYDLILHSRVSKLPEPDELQRRTIKWIPIYGDLKDECTIIRLTGVCKENGVDILINNAAEYKNKELTDFTPSEIKELIAVNLIAPILLIRALWTVLRISGNGLIVNINSIAGKGGGFGESIYAASKAGLSGFTKAVQFETTKVDIRIIDVCFGAMKTAMTLDRKDRDKFIKVEDAANLIFTMCEEYKSLRVPEISICRRNY